MPAPDAAPRRITGLLAVLAAVAVLIFVLTLVLLARNLAATFDDRARADARERIRNGIEAVAQSLIGQAYDYANWTDFYRAAETGDQQWLVENVGTAVVENSQVQLVIVGSAQFGAARGWADSRTPPLAAADLEQTLERAERAIADAALVFGDRPITTYARLAGEVWLLAQTPVWPHTFEPDPDAPVATLIMGTRLSEQLARTLGGGTTLLADIRLQDGSGRPDASQRLEIPGFDASWVTWQVLAPGSEAVRAMLLPLTFALLVLLAVLGAGILVARRFALDLEAARSAAEHASDSKSRFLAQMSHEIRTPLNGVLGMAELLADTPLDPDQTEMLHTIRTSGDSLLSLINEILDLARVESGRLALDPAPFDLHRLLARVRDLHAVLATRKGIVLTVDCDLPAGEHRLGDETRLLQILHNIVGNAVKFTERGSVSLRIRSTGEGVDSRLLIEVRDTGIGMTPEQVSRVFNPYEQAEAGTARRFGGSGLGMSIVRAMVGLMGGEIALSSQPGEGTEVLLTLPLPAMPDAAPLATEAAVLTGPADSLAGCRVLLADDSATNRRVLQLMLAKLGISPRFAEDGLEACDLWKQEDFNLVLMDVEMPRMDGLEALSAMRRHSKQALRAEPKAIAVTANAMTEQVESYLAAGFVDVLSKPISRSALEATLQRHAVG